MSWLSLISEGEDTAWKGRKDRKSGKCKKMWEKWGGGKQKVKQPKLWQGRAPRCWRQRRGQAPCPAELPGRDEDFCVYQGVDGFCQTGIILQVEDQQRNRTRKSKNIIWGKSFICCDLGLNPPIFVVGFVDVVVVIKEGGGPNLGDFNDLLSRMCETWEEKEPTQQLKKARSWYWSWFKA